MCDKNYSHISIILDRSGSMSSIADATISGFNEFLASQRRVDGKATLSLVQFDDEYEVVHDFRNLREISDLNRFTFQPRGMTALFGAMGRTIDELGVKLAALPESLRPSKVIVVTITDGYENATQSTMWGLPYSKEVVKEKINRQSKQYGWDFLYIGANQDAVLSAQSLGIARDFAATYNATASGTSENFKMLSGKLGTYRCSSNKADLHYSNEDRHTLAKS